jgi:hypothetical protein
MMMVNRLQAGMTCFFDGSEVEWEVNMQKYHSYNIYDVIGFKLAVTFYVVMPLA